MSDIIFEPAAKEALLLIENTSEYVFITGNAGVGKSVLVKHIAVICDKSVIIVAPTGIAATNIGGSTIHSMLGIPIGMYVGEHLESDIGFAAFTKGDLHSKCNKLNRGKKQAIRKAKVLIIDEVSMLRADLLDAMEEMLRIIRNTRRPFGGMQMIFVGDMLQLPPVLRTEEQPFFFERYDSEFFFAAKSLKGVNIRKIELVQIHRQNDDAFISILNNLRNMRLSRQDIDALNLTVKSGISTADGVFITTHNYKADIINRRMTEKIKHEQHVHLAEVDGYFNEGSVLAQEALVLKRDMRVMMLVNMPGSYFNGKLGTIINEPSAFVEVKFDDNTVSLIPKYTWENVSLEYDSGSHKMKRVVIGTFTQYPMKAAYAITVHKSQGLSFDKAILDINEVFASGQAYTALSRLRTISGITLLNEVSEDVQIEMNAKLLDFINGA